MQMKEGDKGERRMHARKNERNAPPYRNQKVSPGNCSWLLVVPTGGCAPGMHPARGRAKSPAATSLEHARTLNTIAREIARADSCAPAVILMAAIRPEITPRDKLALQMRRIAQTVRCSTTARSSSCGTPVGISARRRHDGRLGNRDDFE